MKLRSLRKGTFLPICIAIVLFSVLPLAASVDSEYVLKTEFAAQTTCPTPGNGEWVVDCAVFESRRRLVIDHTKVSNSLTSFPVLVKLTPANFNFSASTPNGLDIRFTAADGTTLLNFEREVHDSVNQRAYYWVQIPFVSSTTDTAFYMYYRSSTLLDGSRGAETWDSSYMAVYHMSDGPSGAIRDSTVHANHGTKTAADMPRQVDGLALGAQDFNVGSSAAVLIPSTPSLQPGDDLTAELWVNLESIQDGDQQMLLTKRHACACNYAEYQFNARYVTFGSPWESDNVRFSLDDSVDGSRWASSLAGNIPLSNWTYLVGVQRASDTAQWKAYQDATSHELVWSDNRNDGLRTLNSDPLTLGSLFGPAPRYQLDEVRLSNILRSPEYIKATYFAVRDQILAYGPEEHGPQGIPVLQITPTSLNFGSVPVGGDSQLQAVVTNAGGGILTGSASVDSPFSIASGDSIALPAGRSQSVTVQYQPAAQGNSIASVSLVTNAGNGSIPVSGGGFSETKKFARVRIMADGFPLQGVPVVRLAGDRKDEESFLVRKDPVVFTDLKGQAFFEQVDAKDYIMPLSSGERSQPNGNAGPHGYLYAPNFCISGDPDPKRACQSNSGAIDQLFSSSLKPSPTGEPILWKFPLPGGESSSWRIVTEVGGFVISSGEIDGDPAHTDLAQGFYAIDIAAECGTAVLAAADGDIQLAGKSDGRSGFGNMVVLKHSEGAFSLYAHLDSVTVASGRIQKGDLLGYVGKSETARYHLHFQLFEGEFNVARGQSSSRSSSDLLSRVRLEVSEEGETRSFPLVKFLAGQSYASTNVNAEHGSKPKCSQK